jgi:hypothetical protein
VALSDEDIDGIMGEAWSRGAPVVLLHRGEGDDKRRSFR